MKIEIQNEKENPLLNRKEITAIVKDYKVTPTRKEVADAIVAQLGTNIGQITIDSIDQQFGTKQATAHIKVYKTPETKQKIEKKYKIERLQKAVTKAEKPATKEDKTPAEEKTE